MRVNGYRTREVPVLTPARRQARAPHGFSHDLTELAGQPAPLQDVCQAAAG